MIWASFNPLGIFLHHITFVLKFYLNVVLFVLLLQKRARQTLIWFFVWVISGKWKRVEQTPEV